MEEDQICLYAIAEDTEINLTYNMDYLSKMVSFSKLNAVTKLHFGKKFSMKLQYDLDFIMDQEDDDEVCMENYIRFF